MVIFLRRLVDDEAGQDLAEYAIALAVVAIGVGLIALSIASDVSQLWTTGQTAIAGAL